MKEFESIRKEFDKARQHGTPTSNPDLLELRPWDADGEDLFEWYAVIQGPKGGNYEGEAAKKLSRSALLTRSPR